MHELIFSLHHVDFQEWSSATGLDSTSFSFSSEELLLGNLAFVFVYLDQFSKENRMGCPFCGDMLSQEI